MATDVVYALLAERRQEDELLMLQRPADPGSESADFITQSDLARAAAREGLDLQRGDRCAQVNLVGVLAATRFKTLVAQGGRPY